MSRVRKALELAPRWAALLRSRPAGGAPVVFYGRELPAPGERAEGGVVKFQRLQEAFPNTARGFNIAYLGSNTLPPDWRLLLPYLRRRGVPLVWNQNGVGYPAWAGGRWRRVNEPMRLGLRQARHVVYQSAFCKESADRFAAPSGGSWEILHNAVDTGRFTPAPEPAPPDPLVLVLGGNQYQRYRLETALRTLALLPDARLVVGGRLSWSRDAPAETERLVRELGLGNRVELAGPYAQRDAPALLRRGHLLLHTKVADPCPTVVVEAMACGLPVVYAASGGTPELVGDDAGVGVPVEQSWERDVPPDPASLAEAVRSAAARLDELREGARRRAVERFDLRSWVDRHRAIFEELVP